MAVSFVGSLPTVASTNGGNVTLTFSNLRDAANAAVSLQQGDIVFAAFAWATTANYAAPAISGWTLLDDLYSNGSSFDANLALYYKVMGSTPDASITCNGPGGAANASIGVAFAFRGVNAVSPIDVYTSATHGVTGTATPRANPAAITPLTAGAWVGVVGAGACTTGTAFTNSDLSATTNHFRTGTSPDNNDAVIGFGVKTNWASGSFDPVAWGGGAASPAAGDSWAAITFALKPIINVSVTPNNGSHAHASTQPTIGAKSTVTPTVGLHGHAITQPVVSGPVIPAASSLGHIATQPTIGAKNTIVPIAGSHSQAATQPTIGAKSIVAPVNALHGHASTQPTISAKATISSGSGLHSHASTQPTLAAKSTIAPVAGAHTFGSTQPTISPKATISSGNGAHSHTATQPVVTSFVGVIPSMGMHSHIATQPLMGGSIAIAPANGAHEHDVVEPFITAKMTIVPFHSGHNHLATLPIISWFASTEPVLRATVPVSIRNFDPVSILARQHLVKVTDRSYVVTARPEL